MPPELEPNSSIEDELNALTQESWSKLVAQSKITNNFHGLLPNGYMSVHVRTYNTGSPELRKKIEKVGQKIEELKLSELYFNDQLSGQAIKDRLVRIEKSQFSSLSKEDKRFLIQFIALYNELLHEFSDTELKM